MATRLNKGDRKATGVPFKKGQPGGPGRPKGSKHKLAELFLSALAQDFEVNGDDAIKRVRENDASTYLRVIASVIPKDLNVAVERTVREIDDDSLADIALRGRDGTPREESGPQEHSPVH